MSNEMWRAHAAWDASQGVASTEDEKAAFCAGWMAAQERGAPILTLLETLLQHIDALDRKGMQVPYHGPFSSVAHFPSFQRDFRRLYRDIKACLESEK